jgi:hypothetical protein
MYKPAGKVFIKSKWCPMKSFHINTRLLFLLLSGLLLIQGPGGAMAQLLDGEGPGVADLRVSPRHLQFNAGPGKTQSQVIEVSNYSEEKQTYRVFYQDFELLDDGQARFLKAGTCEQSLSGLLSLSTETIEVNPGETAGVSLTVTVPSGQESEEAAWGIVMIEQVEEKGEPVKVQNAVSPDVSGFTSTLAYGIWLYQNPPSAEDHRVDITNFIIGNKIKNRGVFLKLKNKGDGISFCNAYIEITNLATGELIFIEGKQYTVFPGSRRTIMFELAEELPKGSYSAVGVLDYDNLEELVSTELEFKID